MTVTIDQCVGVVARAEHVGQRQRDEDVHADGHRRPVTGITFQWNAVTNASGYDLRVFDAPSGALLFKGSLAGNSSTNTLVSLNGGSYTFAVRACSATFSDATCGPFSKVNFSISPATPTGAPTITSPTGGANFTTSTQSFNWTMVSRADPNQGLFYQVLLTDLSTGKTELQISMPESSLTTTYTMHSSPFYQLQVRACQSGCGPYSAAVIFSVSLPAVPTTAPSILTGGISGGNSLSTTWTSVSNAEFYLVQVIQPTSGPGGGALTVAAQQVSGTAATLNVPPGAAKIKVAGCNGDGCGPQSADFAINPAGPNPTLPYLGVPTAGSVVSGPGVFFSWNRVPGDNGSNTVYRLYVQDQARQTQALDVYTLSNSYAAYFEAEGSRYDALVIANPGLSSQAVGPASGFNVRGATSASPTPAQPTHQDTGVTGIGTKQQGNSQIAWTPVPGSSLYEYFVAVRGVPTATAVGVTPGLLVQVPLTGSVGTGTGYSAIMRACSPGLQCVIESDTNWGPWSNALGGPGVTNFTVVTGPGNPPGQPRLDIASSTGEVTLVRAVKGPTIFGREDNRTSSGVGELGVSERSPLLLLASARLSGGLFAGEFSLDDHSGPSDSSEPVPDGGLLSASGSFAGGLSRSAPKRLESVTPAGGRRYHFYTPEMSLLAETDLTTGTPSITYEYIWFNGQPVAQVDLPTTTHWTFTDHLGTPLLQTDASAATFWRAEYEPYGRVFSLRTTDQHQPLRLPGQEAEQLNLGANGATERSYNVFRRVREGQSCNRVLLLNGAAVTA